MRHVKTILIVLALTVIVNTIIYTPRVIILSNLEYKRTFVHSVYITNLGKNKPEYQLGVTLEISKYNAWLARMKWLREHGLKVWVPVEIEKERFYEQ